MATRSELIAILKTRGVKGYSGKKKADLEALVKGQVPIQKKVVTEKLGKEFEMAICHAYGIPFDGKYKYGMELSYTLLPRLSKLKELFPPCIHTAKRGAIYDFTSAETHLSAKSIQKGVGKVAPHSIGQAKPATFCERVGWTYTTNPELKKKIQTEYTTLLPILEKNTFGCPIIYYHKQKDTLRFITLHTPIDWTKYPFNWTCSYADWKNSSTLNILTPTGSIALLEFQFHSTSRTNLVIRWCFDTFLTLFKENLTIVDL